MNTSPLRTITQIQLPMINEASSIPDEHFFSPSEIIALNVLDLFCCLFYIEKIIQMRSSGLLTKCLLNVFLMFLAF